MKYHHFTAYERSRIEVFYQLGYSLRKIGKELNRSHTSISRELKRNSVNGLYKAEYVNKNYHQHRIHSKWEGKFTSELDNIIKKHLLLTWSPEQIANTVGFGKVSFKTIYNWLYQDKLSVSLSVLRWKGSNRKQADSRGKFAIGKTIRERPKEIDTRETFGNWELDTMVSSRGKVKGVLLLLWNARLVFTQPSKYQIERRTLCSKLFRICIVYYLKTAFRQLLRIEEKSLLATKMWKIHWEQNYFL